MISQKRLREILVNIRKAKVAVYGDFCLDVYWIMNEGGSEYSVETGQKAKAIEKHYYSPGGASNLVANLAALKPAYLKAIGAIGNDIYGKELISQLKSLHVDTQSLFIQDAEFDTYAFVKEYLNNEEISRTDFGVFNNRSRSVEQLILNQIEKSLEEVDVFIFNQQVSGSIPNQSFIRKANIIFKKFPDKTILLDSRHYGSYFEGVSRKINEREIAALNNVIYESDEFIPITQVEKHANAVFKKGDKPLYITLGDRGMMIVDESGSHIIQGIEFLKQLDPVGAGDTALSALSLSLATGANSFDSGWLANLAASVTVQKRFITGTATSDEILDQNNEPDLKVNILISENKPTIITNNGIEIIDPSATQKLKKVKHIVFDHDGTISTLRYGWENVMQNMMFQAIVGKQRDSISSKTQENILKQVKNYISKSTGIQTILQMEELVTMVDSYGLIPKEQIKSAKDYKAIFIQRLDDLILSRIEEIRQDQGKNTSYTIPGVFEFLNQLNDYEIKLYLASGTDEENVKAEAELMGYAHLFENRIYGSLDDIRKFSKKLIIEKIILENNLGDQGLMIIGDGPVEIREGYRKKAITVGVASDESKPGQLNIEKRKRLIQAGAQIIIPDFREFHNMFRTHRF